MFFLLLFIYLYLINYQHYIKKMPNHDLQDTPMFCQNGINCLTTRKFVLFFNHNKNTIIEKKIAS